MSKLHTQEVLLCYWNLACLRLCLHVIVLTFEYTSGRGAPSPPAADGHIPSLKTKTSPETFRGLSAVRMRWLHSGERVDAA